MRQAIGPLDREHTALQLFEPLFVCGGSFESIEIDVIEGQPSASILVNEGERRAADLVRIEAQALGQSSHEGRLPRSKVPRQKQDVARDEVSRQIGGDSGRVRL